MIQKMILIPGEKLPATIVSWDDKKEDFVIEVSKGITRVELISLVDEIKRLTEWVEDY